MWIRGITSCVHCICASHNFIKRPIAPSSFLMPLLLIPYPWHSATLTFYYLCGYVYIHIDNYSAHLSLGTRKILTLCLLNSSTENFNDSRKVNVYYKIDIKINNTLGIFLFLIILIINNSLAFFLFILRP